MIDVEGLKKITKTLDNIIEELDEKKIDKLNLKRGNRFREFMINNLQRGLIPLEPIRDQSHNPLYDTGKLAEEIEVKLVDKSVEVGYFESNTNRPEGTELTYTEIAIVQSLGFNNGRGVVLPRPFLNIGLRLYSETDIDDRIVDEFIKNVV